MRREYLKGIWKYLPVVGRTRMLNTKRGKRVRKRTHKARKKMRNIKKENNTYLYPSMNSGKMPMESGNLACSITSE